MKETTKRFIKYAQENGIDVTINTDGQQGQFIDIDKNGVETIITPEILNTYLQSGELFKEN